MESQAQARTTFCVGCKKDFKQPQFYNRHRKTKHDKPFPCTLCGGKTAFGLRADLDRHRISSHMPEGFSWRYPCRISNCKYGGASRRNVLLGHMKSKHKEIPLRSLLESFEQFAREGKERLGVEDDRNLKLLGAAYMGKTEEVAELLTQGADISMTDLHGDTALHKAASKGHEAIVEVLCAHGADTGALSSWKITPLMEAARYGKMAAAQKLLDCGADIDCGSARNTGAALIEAVRNKDEAMTSFLVERGSNVNLPNVFSDGSGYNALHVAAGMGTGLTSILLRAKADVDARNGSSGTPLSWAVGIGDILSWAGGIGDIYRRKFNGETTQLLLDAGATVEQCHWDAMPEWFRDRNAKYDPTPRTPPARPAAANSLTTQEPTDVDNISQIVNGDEGTLREN